jgi:peptidoglycan/LPS O-acetylase OafA/YrhL
MYIIPPYRFTVYAMGIMLGYYLRKYKNIRLTRKQIQTGWFITSFNFIATTIMCVISVTYDPISASFFAAIAPVTWCLIFCWIIFAAQAGHKRMFYIIYIKFYIRIKFSDLIIKLLEWRGFKISTNLSYGIYLTQFAVFHYNIGTLRTAVHFDVINTIVSYAIFSTLNLNLI